MPNATLSLPVAKIAYSMAEAAEAASVRKSTITYAIKTGALVARRIPEENGTLAKENGVIVSARDLEAWVDSLDDYMNSQPARKSER
jgi:predicted DNA-binding protein YlxM (UPF0122 family)